MFISKAGTIQSTVVKTICTTGMKDDPAIGLMRTQRALILEWMFSLNTK